MVEELPKLSPEQADALELIRKGENVFISGPAGVGKSLILKTLKAERGWMPVTGTTGLSAFNVGGVTIHSWAGLGILEGTAIQIATHILTENPKARKNIESAEELTLDEVSTLSAEDLDKIDQVFQRVRRNKKPFGGIQMILFGDFLQLPPVATRREIKDLAFNAKCWETVHTRILKRIFRQQDPRFANLLNKIRIGNVDEEVLQLFRDRKISDPEEESLPPVVVHTHNQVVDSINNSRLIALDGYTQKFPAIDKGTKSAKKALEKHCSAATELHLRKRARVMLANNLNQAAGLINGATGFVTGFEYEKGKLVPRVKFDHGPERLIPHSTWEINEGETIVGSRTQIPLRLAWALTIHRIQGQTLSKIKVHLKDTFEYGQAYVAVSRVTTAEGLFIADGSTNCIRSNPQAVKFYRDERLKQALIKMADAGDPDAIELLKVS